MPWRSAAALAGVAAVAAAAALTIGGGGGTAAERAPTRLEEAARWSGIVGAERPRVDVGQRVLVVLSALSLAERVQRAGGRASDTEQRRWTAIAFAAQQQLIANLGRRGVRVQPEFRYTRTINGFSALLDAPAIALLERTAGVEGVYPVRPLFPAATATDLLRREVVDVRPPVTLGGYSGEGVTVALLDTGVDIRRPYLHGRVLPGIDVLGGGVDAQARPRPDDPAQVEAHGTQLAGLLVGLNGPGGLRGVAPRATVLPVRVAGWQPDVEGGFAVYARSDQVLAGLERAVDPNGDGAAHDAARIALIPLVAPFASFSDDPLARAIEGAAKLDTLVVVAAGNDGPAGAVFGSVSGPAGAPSALSVGALDSRARHVHVRVVVRVGLRVLLDRMVPLANAGAPAGRLVLAPAAPRGSGSSERDYFDESGLSVVAERAAVAAAGSSPAAAARHAAVAGARAVLLYGRDVPAGALGIDDAVGVPVVAIPDGVAEALLDAAAGGRDAVVAIGSPRTSAARAGGPAPFSSWGLSFAALVKPEILAPGVGLATATAGTGADGTPAFATISGASAAAAVVAGAAALLAEARPQLDARELRSALVSSARALSRVPAPAQGAGTLDVGRAAAVEVVPQPATVAFGRGSGDGWQGERTLVLRNVSSRTLTVFVASRTRANARVVVEVSPRRVEVGAGRTAHVTVAARVVGFPRGESVSGSLTVTAVGGATLRVPWSVVLAQERRALIGPLDLSARRFRPSERRPAVLTVRAGYVKRSPRGDELRPVLRLDLELWTPEGKRLGLLARLRDVLPGRYAFGLTGRNPAGSVLDPGRYRLRLFAWPTAGGAPATRSTTFTILPD